MERAIRMARRDDGSVYYSEADVRHDYADETIGYFSLDATAEALAAAKDAAIRMACGEWVEIEKS